MSDQKVKWQKLEKDGKVAVLYSPGYGAGWSTWDHENAEALTFDSEIVEAVLAEDRVKAAQIAEAKYGGYTGGARDLRVEWLPKGTAFRIDEYDGSERIEPIGSIDCFTA
jgi:hypothetical protein